MGKVTRAGQHLSLQWVRESRICPQKREAVCERAGPAPDRLSKHFSPEGIASPASSISSSLAWSSSFSQSLLRSLFLKLLGEINFSQCCLSYCWLPTALRVSQYGDTQNPSHTVHKSRQDSQARVTSGTL